MGINEANLLVNEFQWSQPISHWESMKRTYLSMGINEANQLVNGNQLNQPISQWESIKSTN